MSEKASTVLKYYMRRYKIHKAVLVVLSMSLVLSLMRTEIVKPSVPAQALSNISYDHRSFIINGERQLLIVGAIHYPRSSPGMWPHLFRKTKEAGINAIDTYVFWNLHEPIEGHYDFETGYANLPLFLKLAQEHGLYVILRIGPYVCAEWNLGGIPSWMLEKPGMVFRTWNAPYMKAMEVFVRKTVNVVRPYLASVGGPIIAMQMENEYGNVQNEYKQAGQKYIVWAADLANSLNTGVPWFMCQQDKIDTILLTCNGFYCHEWIKQHWKDAYNTPPMFTELWTGWFQHWATPKLTRPAEDLAFSVALWFANGGSFLTYYMWHGGTNFERWGSDFKTTSYDYDSPLNEYGFETIKSYHLARLHRVLNDNAEILLSNDPKNMNFGNNQHGLVFGSLSSADALVFLINSNIEKDATIDFNNQRFHIPKWTALILQKGVEGLFHELFSSSSIAPRPEIHDYRDPSSSPAIITVTKNAIKWIKEPVGIWDASQSVVFERPAEQIRFTHDETDYLWYERSNLDVSLGTDKTTVTISIEPPTDMVYVYIDGKLAHTEEVFVMNVNMDQQGVKNRGSASKVIIPASKFSHSSFNLSILSVTMGLLNYGAFYDKVEKGISGSIKLDHRDITFGNWAHQRGLEGEYKRYYQNPDIHNWRSDIGEALFIPLVWYKITITSDQIKNLLHRNDGADDFVSFALYLGSMGKGYAWVTTQEGVTNSIGRYWDVSSNSIKCETCEWIGSFYPNKCPVGCGGPSQSYYHIPKDWIIGQSYPSSLEIVLFEERGGDPSGVKLVLLK